MKSGRQSDRTKLTGREKAQERNTGQKARDRKIEVRKMAEETLPNIIENEEMLDEVLTRPRRELVQFIREVRSPLVILGAGGKMGPTLAVLARQAAEQANHRLEVVAVSRFSDGSTKDWLEQRGVKTLGCDLLDRRSVKQLPAAEHVIYLVGLKFGTAQDPARTWAINTIVPVNIAEHYSAARIVALSTGNVYPFSSAARGGALESDPLTPLGEYANAAVARERIFEFFSQQQGTRVALLRLFYAVELRYGVLRDIADKIWAGQPIELANSWFNCIWQSDANEMVIRSLSLASSPASAFNLTSPTPFHLKAVANRLGELLGKGVLYAGAEAGSALTGNASKVCSRLGSPATPLETMLRRTAAWVQRGGRSLGKPTHFEVRDGRY
jgi:nucleoside-diphosphate-sugar epimerase